MVTAVIFNSNRREVAADARTLLENNDGDSAWCPAGKDLANMVLDPEQWTVAVAFARAMYRGKDDLPPIPEGVQEYAFDPVAEYREWNPAGPSTHMPRSL